MIVVRIIGLIYINYYEHSKQYRHAKSIIVLDTIVYLEMDRFKYHIKPRVMKCFKWHNVQFREGEKPSILFFFPTIK